MQGLRAVAVLLVIAFHAGLPVGGGFAGVDIFFVISGFVIAGSLLRELEREDRVDLAAFYVRRVKRLLPALAVMLGVVAAASVLFAPAAAIPLGSITGVFAALFSANIYLGFLRQGYFDVSTQLDPLLHTWTLGVEEQFYLVFPAVLCWGWAIRKRSGAAVALTVLGVLSATAAGFTSGLFRFYGSPTRAWEFAAGALLAVGAGLLSKLPRSAGAALGAFGAGLMALVGVAATSSSVFAAIVPAVAAAVLVIAAGCVGPNVISELLALRPLVAIGDLSYSLYLWHWPLIVFAAATFPASQPARLLAAGLSFIPAWLSFRLVEGPIRYSRSLDGRRVIAAVAACLMIPISLSVLSAQIRITQSSEESSGFGRKEHLDHIRGCDRLSSYAALTPRCVWKVADSRGTVALVGDSNAGHFTEGFVAAATRARWTAAVATMPDCPFVAAPLPGVPARCARFVRRSLRALEAHRPSLVVLGDRADNWVGGGGGNWSAGLARVVTALGTAGIPVVVLDPVPPLRMARQDCSSVAILADRCLDRTSRAAADSQLAPTRQAERAAISGRSEVWLVSFETLLCGQHDCTSRRSGVNFYADSIHLSVAGSLALTSAFAHEVLSHARSRRTQSGARAEPTPNKRMPARRE